MNEKKRVLVTSGPTRAYIDRVRYIANTSTGALGSRIVETLTGRGFPVTHLYGAGSEQPRCGSHSLLESVETVTVDDLIRTVECICSRGDVGAVVHAMAVLDYVPAAKFDGKKKSGDESWDIHLVRTPKVIALIREMLPDACFVGFKLETGLDEETLTKSACTLLERYRLDAVVANNIEQVTSDRHEALIVGPGCTVLARLSTKRDIAEKIADFISRHCEITD